MKLNMKKKTWKNIVQYAILIIVGIIMVYPLVWMCFAVFKTNAEISSAAIFPKSGYLMPLTDWETGGWADYIVEIYAQYIYDCNSQGGFHTDFLCIDRI